MSGCLNEDLWPAVGCQLKVVQRFDVAVQVGQLRGHGGEVVHHALVKRVAFA
jgi:hypothetical protein